VWGLEEVSAQQEKAFQEFLFIAMFPVLVELFERTGSPSSHLIRGMARMVNYMYSQAWERSHTPQTAETMNIGNIVVS
jgi:hypothetical protein